MRDARLWTALLIGCLSTAAPTFAKGPGSGVSKDDAGLLHRRARAQMSNLDFESAVTLLESLAARPQLPPATRAEVFIDLAVSRMNLGEQEKAQAAFEQALSLNPNLELPPKTAPKIRAVFQSARAARSPPADAPVAPPPRTTAASLTPPAAVAVRPVEPASPQPMSKAVPITCVAVGAAGLAAGIVAGVASQRIATDLRDNIHEGAEVDRLMKERATLSAVSIGGYAVAAVGAIAAGVTLWLARPSAPVTAAGVITPTGGAASAQIRF